MRLYLPHGALRRLLRHQFFLSLSPASPPLLHINAIGNILDPLNVTDAVFGALPAPPDKSCPRNAWIINMFSFNAFVEAVFLGDCLRGKGMLEPDVLILSDVHSIPPVSSRYHVDKRKIVVSSRPLPVGDMKIKNI